MYSNNTDTTLNDLVDTFAYLFQELTPAGQRLEDVYKDFVFNPKSSLEDFVKNANLKIPETFSETPVESSKDPSVKLSNNLERGLIEIDLPGYKKSDIKITADFKYIFVNVSGTRGAKTYKFKLTETSDVPKISSKMEDGVLSIVVPVKESSKPIDIFVN